MPVGRLPISFGIMVENDAKVSFESKNGIELELERISVGVSTSVSAKTSALSKIEVYYVWFEKFLY